MFSCSGQRIIAAPGRRTAAFSRHHKLRAKRDRVPWLTRVQTSKRVLKLQYLFGARGKRYELLLDAAAGPRLPGEVIRQRAPVAARTDRAVVQLYRVGGRVLSVADSTSASRPQVACHGLCQLSHTSPARSGPRSDVGPPRSLDRCQGPRHLVIAPLLMRQ